MNSDDSRSFSVTATLELCTIKLKTHKQLSIMSMPISNQEPFSWLSIPVRQHVGFMQESLEQCDCEPLFRSSSTGSLKSDETYTPVNYISGEARALLLAYENAGKRRADELVVEDFGSTDAYEPERILAHFAPPKRFFRTFWLSLTIRMLDKEKSKFFKRIEANE